MAKKQTTASNEATEVSETAQKLKALCSFLKENGAEIDETVSLAKLNETLSSVLEAATCEDWTHVRKSLAN